MWDWLIDGIGWSSEVWTVARDHRSKDPNSTSVLASHLLGLLSLFTCSQLLIGFQMGLTLNLCNIELTVGCGEAFVVSDLINPNYKYGPWRGSSADFQFNCRLELGPSSLRNPNMILLDLFIYNIFFFRMR